jgi:hypothetical protein
MAKTRGATSTTEALRDWPETPREVAGQMIERYGEPDDVTSDQAIWHRTGPWKRTVVHRDEVPHRFPKPHTDVLEQFIDYRVPLGRFDDIAAFDGSVIPERTKGEISARCDKEEMNLLALNLADEVASGRRTVDDARQTYTEQAMAAMMKRDAPYTTGFLFDLPRGDTADPDEPTVTPAAARNAEKEIRNAP